MSETHESKQPANNNMVVILLVVAALAIGYLFNKVQMLEKNAGSPTAAAGNPEVTQPARPTELKIKKPSASADHWKGDKNARYILVEYSDLECPFCKSNAETPNKLMGAIKNTAHVFRNFPLSFHQNAQKEAEASECVAELGGNDAYWKYIETIFERTTSNGTGFALDKLGPLAKEVGVNQSKFQTCLDSGKYEQNVKDSLSEASTAGVAATPTTVVYDMKTGKTSVIEGAVPFEQQQTQIEQFIKDNS